MKSTPANHSLAPEINEHRRNSTNFWLGLCHQDLPEEAGEDDAHGFLNLPLDQTGEVTTLGYFRLYIGQPGSQSQPATSIYADGSIPHLIGLSCSADFEFATLI